MSKTLGAAAIATMLKAASYCRTSGEGQRDNTSIPRQKECNEAYIRSNGWRFVRHYVDECRSGSKEDGRTAFQQLMRDVANGEIDVIVIFDIKRFSRSGADIIKNSTFLKDTFGVFVVDTKNQFDSRDRRKTLINYVHAGVSEQERLDIMERMIGGRIRRAQDGLPWTGNRPFGRAFRKTGPQGGEWYVTERGRNMRALLTRYVKGERLTDLVQQYGFSSAQVVLEAVRTSQLSGPYKVLFNAPDIDVVDLEVPIPTMPEVISVDLERRVRQRMEHNRIWSKESLRKYLLTGYAHCGHCGSSLIGCRSKGYVYYRHHHRTAGKCPFRSIRADLLEPHTLNYLYQFHKDQPAFDAAIKNSLPTSADREALQTDIEQATRLVQTVEAQLRNLVNTVAQGADSSLLIEKQQELRGQREAAMSRLRELEESRNALPDLDVIQRQAAQIRLMLTLEHTGKDWSEVTYEEIRRFLRYLFGDNCRKTGNGVFVRQDGDKWHLEFKGHVEFHADVVNGRAIPHQLKSAVEAICREYRQAARKSLRNAGCDSGRENSSARCAGGWREPL